MKQINVISDVYKNTSVNFNGFIVNFDIEGKGVLSFEEKQTESVEKVFEMHPNIYKGDKLPAKEKVEAPANKEETAAEVATSNVELEHLKQSNKDLALENASLKKENETLKKEKEELEDKICTLEAEKSEENAGGKEEEGKADRALWNEEISLKEDLNKKTVPQLKELLNTDDFLPFKEEWKSLTKKDDIINYILKKVEEDEKK
jgi:hypothetical protein